MRHVFSIYGRTEMPQCSPLCCERKQGQKAAESQTAALAAESSEAKRHEPLTGMEGRKTFCPSPSDCGGSNEEAKNFDQAKNRSCQEVSLGIYSF